MKSFLAISYSPHDFHNLIHSFTIYCAILPKFGLQKELEYVHVQSIPNSLAENVWSMCLENISHIMDDGQAAFSARIYWLTFLNSVITHIFRSSRNNIFHQMLALVVSQPSYMYLNEKSIIRKCSSSTSHTCRDVTGRLPSICLFDYKSK